MSVSCFSCFVLLLFLVGSFGFFLLRFRIFFGYLIGTCITMEYFGYGFGFVGLTLFMMQQIAPGKHQMSHYAFASGIMNLGVMLPGMVSGYLSDLLGYRNFFIYVLIATIPAFLITYFIPFTYDDSKNNNIKNNDYE